MRDLATYRFKIPNNGDDKSKERIPSEGIGDILLKRLHLVNSIYEMFDKGVPFDNGKYQSVYVHGMRASGKTQLLKLLGKKLLDDKFEVYHFTSSKMLNNIPELMDLLPKDRLVAVLVDEVQNDPTTMVDLLKGHRSNLFIIGFGVPQYLKTNITAMFQEEITSDIFITKDSDELQELISYWKDRVAKDIAVKEICEYICEYCGGQIYPILKFTEFAFTLDDGQSRIKSVADFMKHFLNQKYKHSVEYQKVVKRCVGTELDVAVHNTFERVLRGQGSDADVVALTRLGWYYISEDRKKRDIRSTFLANVILERVAITEDPKIYISDTNTPQENLELLIVNGLANMESSDFECANKRSKDEWVKVEDGMSMSWAISVSKSVRNVFMEFQSRAAQGRVDFYCNGIIDGVIENLCDATKTMNIASKGGSQDIDEHHSRFTSQKYQWSNWAILNFEMSKSKEERILPRDETYHSRVYTYVHADNTLYQGKAPIKSPAVLSLKATGRKVDYIPFQHIPEKDRKKIDAPFNNTKRAFSSMSKLWLYRYGSKILR